MYNKHKPKHVLKESIQKIKNNKSVKKITECIDWSQTPQEIFDRIKDISQRNDRYFDVFIDLSFDKQWLCIHSLYGDQKWVVENESNIKLHEFVCNTIIHYIQQNIRLVHIVRTMSLDINVIFCGSYHVFDNLKSSIKAYLTKHYKQITEINQLNPSITFNKVNRKIREITCDSFKIHDEQSNNILKSIDYTYITRLYDKGKKSNHDVCSDDDLLQYYNDKRSEVIEQVRYQSEEDVNVYQTVLIMKDDLDRLNHKVVVLEKQNELLVKTVNELEQKYSNEINQLKQENIKLRQRLSALENKQ